MPERTTMYRNTYLQFAAIVLSFYSLLWGAEMLFPKSSASASVLLAFTVFGIFYVRPGWNLRAVRLNQYCLLLFAAIFFSAALAAWVLTLLKISLPYDFSTLKITAAIPGIIAISGIEELLFRQLMFRWLEQRQLARRMIVIATALAFGGAHLGPVFIGSTAGAAFFLLQSAFMVWMGTLWGEIRSSTESWLMSWLGHFGYNVAVLYFLSIAR